MNHVSGYHPDLGLGGGDADLRSLVGSRFGLVEATYRLASDDQGGACPHVYTATGALRGTWGERSPGAYGTGVAMRQELARITAISEAVERYSSLFPPSGPNLIRSSFSNLRVEAISPRSWLRLSAQQYYPRSRPNELTDDKVIDWCAAYSLTRSKSVLVPALQVYMGLPFTPPNDYVAERPLSGTACHTSFSMAIRSGLFEVLERDALMIAWLNRLRPRSIDVGGTPLAATVACLSAHMDGDYTFYDLPTDTGLPIVMAVGWRAEMPYACVGAACRTDYVSAATKALYEVVQVQHRYAHRVPTFPARIQTLDDHSDLYATSLGADVLREVLHEPGPGGPSLRIEMCTGTPEDVGSIVRRLAEAGLDVLCVDLTQRDLATAGLRIARVLVPTSIDMNIDQRWIPYGAPRVYQLPVRLGLRDSPLSEAELNHLPVPLA